MTWSVLQILRPLNKRTLWIKYTLLPVKEGCLRMLSYKNGKIINDCAKHFGNNTLDWPKIVIVQMCIGILLCTNKFDKIFLHIGISLQLQLLVSPQYCVFPLMFLISTFSYIKHWAKYVVNLTETRVQYKVKFEANY